MRRVSCIPSGVKTGSSVLHNKWIFSQMRGVVMKCGTYLNKWLQTTSEPEPCEAIAIHFDEEIIKKAFEGSIPEFIKRNQPENRICIQKVQVDAMVRNYVESLMFYFNNPSLVNDELLYLKVKELVLMLSKTENSTQLMSIFQGIFDPAVFTFKEIVTNNLFENLSLDDWALLTNLSVSTFQAEVRRCLWGQSRPLCEGQKIGKSG